MIDGTTSDSRVATPEMVTVQATEHDSAAAIAAWLEKNQTALRIISFTVIERLQGPIRLGTSAKAAGEGACVKEQAAQVQLAEAAFSFGHGTWSIVGGA